MAHEHADRARTGGRAELRGAIVQFARAIRYEIGEVDI
jgi:hypothetical protein